MARPAPPKKKVRKYLPKQSKKREGENREYSKRRKAFLLAHPLCEAWLVFVDHIFDNPGGAISLIDLPSQHPPSSEIHHMRKPRCKYLNDESTWLAVAPECHRLIESHKSTARMLGLLH